MDSNCPEKVKKKRKKVHSITNREQGLVERVEVLLGYHLQLDRVEGQGGV